MFQALGKWYSKRLTKDLTKFGLRAEDLIQIHERDASIGFAKQLMNENDKQDRNFRLYRAQQIWMTHSQIPENVQKEMKKQVWNTDFYDKLKQFRDRNAEKEDF